MRARTSRGLILPALLLLGAAAGPAPGPPGFVLVAVPVPSAPQRLEAGDLDGDGDTDLMVLSLGGHSMPLQVLSNTGGTFTPGWSTGIPKTISFDDPDLDLGDLDHDGDLDLIASLPYTALQSRMNAGNATFDVVNQLSSLGARVQNVLGTMDGDHVPDLATYEIDAFGYIGGHKGIGDGTFQQKNEKSVGGQDFATRAQLGDVTGDGVLDLVLASFNGVRYTKGAAGPFPLWNSSLSASTDAALDLALADLSGDGRLDVVASIPASNAIEVFYGQAGSLSGPSPFPAGAKPGPLAVADMDLDGFLDVVIINQIGQTISVNSGSSGGVFLDLKRFRGGPGATDIVAADLDNDGDQDLAETLNDGRVLLMFNKLVP